MNHHGKQLRTRSSSGHIQHNSDGGLSAPANTAGAHPSRQHQAFSQEREKTCSRPCTVLASLFLCPHHLRGNDYRCKSFIFSKTISVNKKITEIFFAELINSKKKINPHEITDVTDIADFTEKRAGSWSTPVHISKHSLVGCRLCAYPRIHLFVSRSRSVA